MAPFSCLMENKPITKDDLLKSGFLKDDVDISDDQVEKLSTKARMCMMLVKTLSDIDGETLAQIETLAQSLQLGLQDELGKLSDDEKTDADPAEVLNTLFTNLQNTVGDGNGLPRP